MDTDIAYYSILGKRDTYYKVIIIGNREWGKHMALSRQMSKITMKYCGCNLDYRSKLRCYVPYSLDARDVESTNELHAKITKSDKPLISSINEEAITLKEYFDIIGYDSRSRKIQGKTLNTFVKNTIKTHNII